MPSFNWYESTVPEKIQYCCAKMHWSLREVAQYLDIRMDRLDKYYSQNWALPYKLERKLKLICTSQSTSYTPSDVPPIREQLKSSEVLSEQVDPIFFYQAQGFLVANMLAYYLAITIKANENLEKLKPLIICRSIYGRPNSTWIVELEVPGNRFASIKAEIRWPKDHGVNVTYIASKKCFTAPSERRYKGISDHVLKCASNFMVRALASEIPQDYAQKHRTSIRQG